MDRDSADVQHIPPKDDEELYFLQSIDIKRFQWAFKLNLNEYYQDEYTGVRDRDALVDMGLMLTSIDYQDRMSAHIIAKSILELSQRS
ncbi:hypothetical protein BGAL_0488g00050 [Botrytis galanthina]|uniref:Uncharacterized protein n=1 Tax=Botrytis galanthina TaxID=278940 RepID=A0A4S8QKP4_9HELO|nr:hypothetical protein BGAL_0488g00050 [Botrytis galanthina]